MTLQTEFATFCETQHPRLVGALTLFTGDADLAHDLTQDTLARLWRDWSRVRAADSPEAYAYKAGINVAKNHFRWRMSSRRREQQCAQTQRGVHEDADTVTALAVREAVAALPTEKRTALTTVAVVAVVGVLAGPLARPPAPEIGPIGEIESPSLGAVVVHDAWLEVDEAIFADENNDRSPDEARSDQHVWDEQQQAWVGPRQSLYLHLEIPEGADGFLIEDDDGLIRPTRSNWNPGPWVVSVPLEVYHDRTQETADELGVIIRAVASGSEEQDEPTALPDWPGITEVSAPTRVSEVRSER